jgi:hypothetical protein
LPAAWRSAAAVGGCALMLCACQTLKPKTAPVASVEVPPASGAPAPVAVAPAARQVVEVPVKQACVPRSFPKPPKYPDSDTALRDAGGAADRYQLMAAGRVLRERRLAELEKALDACR